MVMISFWVRLLHFMSLLFHSQRLKKALICRLCMILYTIGINCTNMIIWSSRVLSLTLSLFVWYWAVLCYTHYVFFRTQIRNKFGHQTEAFFVILTAIQFHTLFYSTRPLPNTLAAALVNMSYGYWLQGRFYIALQFLIVATIVFRCDMLLLLGPIGLELLLTRSISLMKAIKYSLSTARFSIGLSMLIDSYMWKRTLWPEFEVFWFNSVLNRSSEWGVHPFHWYFTSALPRALLEIHILSLWLDYYLTGGSCHTFFLY